jgi:hypothetical protein
MTSIDSIGLDAADVLGEFVTTKFIPLSYIKEHLKGIFWKKNAKKHDIGSLRQSIEKYGFLDFPKWDINLNDGAGGIVTGNGRTNTLIGLLIELSASGEEPPRGIPISRDSGEWCVPVNFGVDAPSESIAQAYAIDHNNLTMMGGDFSLSDIKRMWDNDYTSLLTEISNQGVLPVTVDADDIATLLAGEAAKPPPEDFDEYGDDIKTDHQCPSCGYQWSGGK